MRPATRLLVTKQQQSGSLRIPLFRSTTARVHAEGDLWRNTFPIPAWNLFSGASRPFDLDPDSTGVRLFVLFCFLFFIVRYELKMKCHDNLLSPFFVTFFISYFAPFTSSFFRGIVLWTTGERNELEHVRGVHSLSFGSRPSVEWLTQVTTAFAFHNHKRRTIFFLLFFISRYLPLYRIISTISSATCFVFCRCRDGGRELWMINKWSFTLFTKSRLDSAKTRYQLC